MNKINFSLQGLPVIWLEDKQCYIIYSPFIRKFAVINNQEAFTNQKKIVRILMEKGFWSTPQIEKERKINVVFTVTKQCNLNCIYCFANASFLRKEKLSPSDAISVLAAIANKQTIQTIHFIGGEPTLNFETIKTIVEYAERTCHLPIKFFITTNGVIPEKKLAWLVQKGFIFTVSWDGIMHDISRSTKEGIPTFQKVCKTIKFLVNKNAHFRVRMTVTSLNLSTLPQSLKWCIENGVSFFHPEPMRPDGRAKNFQTLVVRPDKFCAMFRKITKMAEDKGIWIINSALANLFSPKDHFCSSVHGKTLHINPDGSISRCYQVQSKNEFLSKYFLAGDWKKENDCTLKIRKFFPKKLKFYSKCNQCFLQSICLSGCYYRHLSSLTKFDKWMCDIRKKIICFSIEHLYRRYSKGKISCLEGTYRFYSNYIIRS